MDPLRGTSEPTALVEVRLTRDPASSDVSAAPPLLAFTAADWDAPQTVTVSAAEDDDAVADGSVAIRHEVSGGDYDSVPAARVTVTIAENDVPTLSVADAEVSEGAPGGDLAVVFQVELSVPSDNEVTADYATSDGSGLEGAAAGSDYEATTGTVRFPPLTTMAQPIRVPVTDDAVDEAELETFTLTLHNVSGASLLGGGPALRATGTIRDDDDPEVEASFGALRYEAPEGGSVTVTVRLSADPERLVTIPLLRTPVGGIAEHDYSGVPESIAFGSGQTAREFTFTATDDAADDDGEAVVLSFGSLPPRVSGSGETTLAIRDNDGGGGNDGSGGGGGAPPSDDEDEDEDDEDDDGGGGGPPKADFTLSAACPEDLCRARTGSAVTFEDTSTGRVESRRWDFGDGTGSRNQRIDHAWSSPGFYEVTLSVSDGTSTSTTKQVFLVEASDPAGTCVADAGTLCLQDSRYAVAVEWRTADGNSGAGGLGHSGTNDSGVFRFFSEDNWEVLIKVLDGCALNGHVWVYGASTTDLGYTIRVTDTVTGTVKEYRNQPGLPAPAITDATAFPQGCRTVRVDTLRPVLLIVRHGETASNAARIVQVPETPLNERGMAQAEQLATRLVEHHRERPIGQVVASDLRRAEMTAEPVAAALGLPLIIEPLLAERNFGDLRGRAYADIGLDIMEPGYEPPAGEDWPSFHRRVTQAWSRMRELARETEGDSVFVTHGLVCHSLALHHLDLGGGVEQPDRWGNTSVTYVEDRAPWRVTRINCCDHLDATTADGGQMSGI